MNEQITGEVLHFRLPCNIPKMEWLRVPVCVRVQNFQSEVAFRGQYSEESRMLPLPT